MVEYVDGHDQQDEDHQADYHVGAVFDAGSREVVFAVLAVGFEFSFL